MELLKDTKIDEYLHGRDLSTKIEENKALTKESVELVKKTPLTTTSSQKTRGAQAKPKFSFRGKQQYVNHKNQGSQNRSSSSAQAQNPYRKYIIKGYKIELDQVVRKKSNITKKYSVDNEMNKRIRNSIPELEKKEP
ncbi:hypothetical protein TKK_0015682 [Trichogramma kaykai]